MKAVISIIAVVLGTVVSQFSQAACSHTTMDTDTLMECITIEGSGTDYAEWRAQYSGKPEAGISSSSDANQQGDTATAEVTD